MIFGSGYQGPMRSYHASPAGYLGSFSHPVSDDGQKIEGSIDGSGAVGVADMGMSVTEGARFGSLIQTAQNAIRLGTGAIELATIQGGAEPGGAESYGHEARQALRELARANNVYFTSVHTPTNSVANLSGYNPQERGFNDEFRHREMEEVKKAIEFAADVGGGAVVVHTGEAQRDMSTAPWNREIYPGQKEFLGFDEEQGRQVLYMVDDRNGKLITEVRKSQTVFEPDFETTVIDGKEVYVDQDGNPLQDETDFDNLFRRVPKWDSGGTKFKTKRRDWQFFVDKAARWNQNHPREDGRDWTAEDIFFRTQMETRVLQHRGHSLFYGRSYEESQRARDEMLKAYDHYKKLEDSMSPEELWKVMEQDSKMGRHGYGVMGKFVPTEGKLPTQIIKEAIHQQNLDLKHIREASAAADAEADQIIETLEHVKPAQVYAKEITSKSYAEAGILAMEQTKNNPYAKRDIFVAPENLWPEMGYGTHPRELLELVTVAREKMIQFLTEKEIPSRQEMRDEEGNLKMEINPFYTGMNKKDAQEYAKRHIKATFDTQHLGMWWKHFQPMPGETKDERKGRFMTWFKDEVKNLHEHDIIGHIHAVDSLGGGHHHLPVGQGDLPIKEMLEWMRRKGYKGTMISEGHEEDGRFGAGRQMTETWSHLGSNMVGLGYGMGAPAPAFSDVHHSYFRSMQNPYFIFGAYSPSNDWQLWTQVPME